MIYFIGAGPGDPDLVTVKAQKILQIADAILFTGSLVPKEVLSWCKKDAIIEDSQGMKYPEIFDSFKNFRISVDLAGVEPASESPSIRASPITVIILTFPPCGT